MAVWFLCHDHWENAIKNEGHRARFCMGWMTPGWRYIKGQEFHELSVERTGKTVISVLLVTRPALKIS